MTHSFPKKCRLNGIDSFTAKSTDLTLKTPVLVLVAKKNTITIPRLGMVVSKKAEPKASRRVFLKRIFRESFRLHQEDLSQVDVILIARRGLSAFSAIDVRRHVDTQIEQLILRL